MWYSGIGIAHGDGSRSDGKQAIQKGDTIFCGGNWYLQNLKTTANPREQNTFPFAVTDSSADSGVEFNLSVITAMMGTSYHPQSVIQNHNVLYSWFGSGEGSVNVFAAQSSDFGVTWLDSIRLSPLGPTANEYCNIGSDDSLVYVVWKGGGEDSTFLRSIAHGTSVWSPITGVAGYNEGGNPFTYRPDVVADQGFLSVVYEGSNINGHYLRSKQSSDFGVTWGAESVVGGLPCGKGAEIAFGSGVLHAIRGSCGSPEIRYNKSTDFGVNWSVDNFISDTDGYSSQWPSISADPYGTVYATWFDYKDSPNADTGYLFFRRSTDQGISWDSIQYLSTEPLSTWSDVYSDSLGVYVVWSRSEYPKQCYFRMSRDRGMTWSEERQLGDPLADISEPEIDGDGYYLAVSGRTLRSGQYVAPTHILGGFVISGDADGNRLITISDAVYLINYIFAGSNAPVLHATGDFNGDAQTNISDVVSIINYIFGGK
ncbi:MAG: dockerin type I domain-containing protein [Candidatus Zixiibacteriota bacterium]